MIVATKNIEPEFLRAIEGRSESWALRALAGYATRSAYGDLAPDELERADAYGLCRAETDEERQAWEFGFGWPDREKAP